MFLLCMTNFFLYWNMNDWAPDMIMGRPTWLASHGYPEMDKWPTAELTFNTNYVWSHTEFNPQQTMRGKMALYAYLYGLSLKKKKWEINLCNSYLFYICFRGL